MAFAWADRGKWRKTSGISVSRLRIVPQVSLMQFWNSTLSWLTNLLLTYLLPPWSRVLLVKLIAFHLVKKFPAYCGTRTFITAFTSARHLSLSWANSIQSIPSHHNSWRTILILSSHRRLGFPSGVFPSNFPTKTLYTPHLTPLRPTCPAHLLDFITRTILGEEYRSLCSSLCSFLHSPVTSSLLAPNILLSTLFSKQFRDTRHYYAFSTLKFNTRLQYFSPVYHPFHRASPVYHAQIIPCSVK
jgi:hypothetical protein